MRPRPADVLQTTAHVAEESIGYPFSDPEGRSSSLTFFQLVSPPPVYLIVDSRLIKLITGQPFSLGGFLDSRF